jgi:hypothetical protein
MRVSGFLVTILLAFGLAACSRARRVHVRGDLDRTKWVVRLCGSGDSYSVILTSGQWAHLLDYQKQFGISDTDPLLIEFDGTTIPPKWPWDTIETVGIDGPMKLECGTCQ